MPRLADFAGRWTLARVLTDHLDTMSGALAGEAVFAPEGAAGLRYIEEGTLTLASGARLQAERRYLWREAGARIAVFFDDGVPFHEFAPNGRVQGSAHLCGADLYTVAYDFTNWPVWEALWQVKGPKKDYTAQSTYTRG